MSPKIFAIACCATMFAGAVSLEAQPVKLTEKEAALLTKSAQQYRDTVYDPEIPRAFAVNQLGCPACKDKFLKYGAYGWIITEDKPFKVQCPACKRIFPDNDFEKYYRTKDKSLLTGEFVDDGRGIKLPGEKQKYWVVAYYHHWMLYKHNFVLELVSAYKRTGNAEFARRLFARLDRYAEVYSRYNYNTQSRYAEEVYSGYNGRMVNAIWETFLSRDIAHAYRISKSFLDKEDAELQKVTGKTSAEIKKNIEENMLRIMAADIMSGNGKNAGNFGMHQNALLEISAALEDKNMWRWVTDFRPVYSWSSTPLNYALYCNFYNDGAPGESPGYNRHWLINLTEIAKQLELNGVDIKKQHRHYQRILDYAHNLSLCAKFMSASGDTGGIKSMGGAFFGKDHPDKLAGYRSTLLPGYGTASLQNQNPAAPAAFWMTFGAYIGHKHLDGLHIELYANNIPMMPDFGYPESASADDRVRPAWFTNTVSHNTVVVNSSAQRTSHGKLLHYDAGKFVQRIEVDAPELYKGLQEYRRTDIVCEPSAGKLVVLDIFRVKGGKQHDWFIHGTNGKAQYNGIDFTPQGGGTLAGKDVDFGFYYDDKKLQGKVTNYGSYRGSGFQYLTNVMSADGKSGSSVIFPVNKGLGFNPSAENTALKIHPVNGEGEKWFLSEGPTQRNHKNVPKTLPFFTRRTVGKAPLQSVFISVLETASADAPVITDIKTLAADYENVDIVITFSDNSTLRISDFDKIKNNLRTQVILTDADGREKAAYKYSGKTFTAKLKSVDLLNESVIFDRDIPAEFADTIFRVGRHAYKIGSIEGSKITLKDQSMIRGRFRMLNKKPIPPLNLATKEMYVYNSDAKTVIGKYPASLPADHPADQDLWIGMCAPGDEAVFVCPSERNIK